MKRLALATLLSSILVAAISLAGYFVMREMGPPSEVSFLLWDLLASNFVLVLALLPAAMVLPTVLESTAAVVLASCLGTVAAVITVVLRLWGSLSYIGTGGAEILFQLNALLLPAAIALAIGALWRHWRSIRTRRTAAGV